VRWAGSEVNGLAGSSVAGLGDFDGDGRADVAVGEPKRDTAAGADSGAVHVIFDPARGGSLDDPATTLTIRGAARATSQASTSTPPAMSTATGAPT
jgi:hypothetical protein